jgi:hypothetical protein
VTALLGNVLIDVAVSLVGPITVWAWLHRRDLSLLASAIRPGLRVRVSAAALLRIYEDDGYILFSSRNRPGSYGPIGGVIKYRLASRNELERFGFREETRRHPDMRYDLRGFLPARSLARFVRWWRSGSGRENSTECLRRELTKACAGLPALAVPLDQLSFVPVRTALDGPLKVAAQAYRQFRLLEVCDLDLGAPGAALLRQRLLDLAADPAWPQVIRVTIADIEYGRWKECYIQPQSAFLFGGRRLNADIPMLR